MKMSKKIKLLIPMAALLGYAIKKRKISSITISDIVQTVSDADINLEKTFAGFKESELNEIAKDTSRGIKAVIVDNLVEYYYESRSGKQTATAKIELNSDGKPIITFSPHSGTAKSPYLFVRTLIELMNKDN